MKRLLMMVLVGSVMVLSAHPLMAISFTEESWAIVEPVVALNPNAPDYIVLNRTAVSSTDVAYASLRALELKNPGVTRSAVAEALSFMFHDGRLLIEASGEDFVKTEEGYEALNAGLRYELARLIQPLLKLTKLALSEGDIQILVCASCDVSGVDLTDVPIVTTAWYDMSVAGQTVYRNTDCMPCSNPDGSAYCPGQCVSGCDTAGSSCQVETVNPGNDLTALTLQRAQWR